MNHRPDLFNHVVNTLRSGACAHELSSALHVCVETARETGKAAKLILEISIKPNGHSGQYEISDVMKTKLPKIDQGVTIVFGTPDGNLIREDPRQQDLKLKRVPLENTSDLIYKSLSPGA